MDAYEDDDHDEPAPDADRLAEESAGTLLNGLPLDECDHREILCSMISQGAEAALETFFEAKSPDIDPALKLKLIGLASRLGDNVRKAIATHATHFRGEK